MYLHGLWFTLSLAGISLLAGADGVTVRSTEELREALRNAQPGARIRIAPGDYTGGLYFSNIRGTQEKPIVIGAADPAKPPRLVGGGTVLQFSEVAYLELHDLVLTEGRANGLNIDDGGTFDTPSHHITLRNLRVSDINLRGNFDGIKLSGVDDFRVENCVVERWGGQGIDMVGCHRGVIEGCRFIAAEGTQVAGVQAKGGSSEIVVRRCTFRGTARGVNAGGSTGLAFFRPKVQGYEAKEIRIEGNIFDRCQAAIAFVGVDGAVARYNTIYHPTRWALRILQETTAPGFVPSRNGVFEDNIIVFQSNSWFEGGVNIGPNTAPETFRFARNVWYCEDRPERSQPRLPTPETDGIVGKDPLLRDPEKGDFSLKPGSPAEGKGATALPDR